MADFGKWFTNPLTQGLQNQAADAQRKARAAQNEVQRANQRANDSSDRAIQRSEELLDVKNELVDKNAEIRKLKQKLEETEAVIFELNNKTTQLEVILKDKTTHLKDYVLSQTSWKAVANNIALQLEISKDELQHQVDLIAIEHVKNNSNQGFEKTSTFINSLKRIDSNKK